MSDILSLNVEDIIVPDEIELRPDDLELCLKNLPNGVFETIKDRKCCVAGGYIRDTVLQCDAPKDIDIFTDSEESARIIAKRLLDRSPYLRLNHKDKEIIETGKALTIANAYKGPQPQVIFRWVFDDMSKVIDAFDFTCAQAAFWWDGARFVSRCAPAFYQDAESMKLVYTSPVDNDPVGSLVRVVKFSRDGYDIDADSLSKVVADICTATSYNDISNEGYFNDIKSRMPINGLKKY